MTPHVRSRDARSTGRASRLACLVALVLATAVGCGSSEDGPVPPVDGNGDVDGPRVADARFDGDFVVLAVTARGDGQPLIGEPTISMETEFASLSVRPGCNTYFGSFTLNEDGTASFTVAGGSRDDCGELADQEAAIIAALGGATTWSETGTGFRFDGGGTSIEIAR